MRKGAHGLAIALAVLASCRRTPAPLPTAGDASAGSPTSSADACSTISALARTEDAGTPVGNGTSCAKTQRGAWGVIGRVSMGNPLVMGASMQARLVHAGGGAATASAELAVREIDELRVFDFDGDGEEELLVLGRGLPCAVSGEDGCETPLPLLQIFSFKSGAVAPYTPSVNVVVPPGTPPRVAFVSAPGKLAEEDRAVTLVSVTDADGDGRPDVTSHLRYELAATDGDVTSYRVAGPLFLGHALPDGSFSFTDPVAMKELAKTCGSAPILEQARGSQLYAAAVCERLMGRAPSDLARRWGRRCAVLESERAKQMDRVKSGAQLDATSIDWTVTAVCRKETEGGWNDVKGMPTSVERMLEETQPLRSAAWPHP